MKIGLALGSGGARGWASIGVIRELEAAGVKPDVVAGTSMGAVVGAFYALGRLDELERFGKTLTNKRLLSLMDLTFTGQSFFSGKKLMVEVQRTLNGAKFSDCTVPLGVVTTEVGNGHEVWLRDGPLCVALAASCALPGVLDPVKINGSWCIDGALVNPVPVTLARAMGADVVVSVNVVSDTMYRSRLLHEVIEGREDARTVEKAIDKSILRFIPGFKGDGAEKPPPVASIMSSSLDIMLDRIRRARLAGDPPDASVNVRVDEAGMFDFHMCAELIEIGRRAARAMMPNVLETLGRTCPSGVAVDGTE